MFRKQMKKVYRNGEFVGSYTIGLRKKDKIDEAKFQANICEDDDKKCEVIVLFQDEYNSLINERDSLKKEVQDLKLSISDKDNQIKEANAKLDENNRLYIDKVTQSSKDLNKEFSDKLASVTSEKQKEIDTLKDNISDLKQTHSDEVHELDSNYKSTLIRLRTEDNNEISDFHKKIDRIKADFKDLGFFEKHSKKYDNLISELDESLNDFEKTNKNKLLTIDEDFAKLPTKEVGEANERNE